MEIASLDLPTFLERPIKLTTYKWSEGTSLVISSDPLKQLLVNNAAIKRKLQNYQYIRADLRLTLTVAASPLQYGAVLAAYTPLEGITTSTSYGHVCAASHVGDSEPATMLQLSTGKFQGWLFPQHSTTLHMDIPYIFPLEWIDLTRVPSHLGRLRCYSTGNLLVAGAPGSTFCTVTVYASLANVKLMGTTATLQSNTLAGASKDLANAGLPGAASLTKVASRAMRLLGMCNDSTDMASRPVVNSILPGLSNTETSPCAEAFGTGGLPVLSNNQDHPELDIASLARKESYIGAMGWAISDLQGAAKGSFFGTPSYCRYKAQTGLSGGTFYAVASTPACYLTTMYSSWRGTVCFKFVPVCSQFHRGRLRVYMDSKQLSSTPDEGTVPSYIMDLATDKELVVKMPMTSQSPWQWRGPMWTLGQLLLQPFSLSAAAPTATFETEVHTGSLRVEVDQQLMAPIAAGDVSVLVFTWIEDFFVANPLSAPASNVGSPVLCPPTVFQSKVAIKTSQDPEPEIAPPVVDPVVFQSNDNVDTGHAVPTLQLAPLINKASPFDCYIGEDIVSIKQLTMRSAFSRRLAVSRDTLPGTTVAGALCTVDFTLPRVPRPFGQETVAVYSTIASRNPFNWAINYANTLPFHFVAAMFHGYKGSIRWKIRYEASPGFTKFPISMKLLRSAYLGGAAVTTSATGSASAVARHAFTQCSEAYGGCAVATSNHPALCVDIPDYTTVIFQPSNFYDMASAYITSVVDGRLGSTTPIDQITILLNAISTGSVADLTEMPTSVETYVAACPDMQYFHYKQIPLVWISLTNPIPAAHITS